MTQTHENPRSLRLFFRHYAEMVIVMFAGMIALGMPAEAILDPRLMPVAPCRDKPAPTAPARGPGS